MNDLIDNCKIQGYISYQKVDINKINPMIMRKDVGMVLKILTLFLCPYLITSVLKLDDKEKMS